MSLARNLLLAGSQSAWLREHATRYPFVRRSVSRFMPGERAEDAARAGVADDGGDVRQDVGLRNEAFDVDMRRLRTE